MHTHFPCPTRHRAHTDTSLAAYECGLPPPRAATGSPASLLSRLSRSRTPTLLLHGAQDPLHPASHSKAVYHALRAGEATTRLVLYEGEGHALRSPEHRRDANQRVCAWFRAHMPGATPPVFVH